MKNFMIFLAAAAVVAAMFAGCHNVARKAADRLVEVGGAASGAVDLPVGVVADASEVAKLRSEAVETLTVGANSYRLEAYLWRDFMPGAVAESASINVSGAAESGGSLTAINWLVEANSAAIPRDITFRRQFVIHGDQIWVADYTDETRPSTEAYKLEKVSRGGPEWGPDVNVDVIAEVSIAGKSYFLIRKNVPIVATY